MANRLVSPYAANGRKPAKETRAPNGSLDPDAKAAAEAKAQGDNMPLSGTTYPPPKHGFHVS